MLRFAAARRRGRAPGARSRRTPGLYHTLLQKNTIRTDHVSSDFSEAIDYRQAALDARRMAGVVPLVRFERVVQVAADAEGEVDVALRFERDAAGRHLVRGRLRADIALVCQRCLEPMRHALDTRFRVAVVTDDREAGSLPPDLEAWVVPDRHLDALTLLEDELLLSLPIVARHEGEECRAPAVAPGTSATSEDTRGESPFAVLRELNSGKTPENH